MNEKQIKNDFFQMASNLNVGYIVSFHEYVRDKLEDKESELSELINSFSGVALNRQTCLPNKKHFQKYFRSNYQSILFYCYIATWKSLFIIFGKFIVQMLTLAVRTWEVFQDTNLFLSAYSIMIFPIAIFGSL